ncbi:MAG TPA: VIT1/CCC1 transporter family protein [Parachlamydiaceae bacterium]|nr:VIT1/CCC1 transporter family protein [Parachlamydiaceae bacterium]
MREQEMPTENDPSHSPSHFNGKDALQHVIKAQAEGIASSSEVHGTEIPGHLSAAGDAARETAILLPMIWLLLDNLNDVPLKNLALLLIFTFGWLLWKCGRAAWLGWFRLERLHRVLEQERWEIEHHYQQERDELRVLYAVKGFEGKLLEDVLDVLMADNDRLLKVMVEEELGLSLEKTEHPLEQGLGASVGVLIAALLCLAVAYFWSEYGIYLGAVIAITLSSAASAYLAKNQIVPAIVWNLGLAALAVGSVFFLLKWYQPSVN